MKNMRLVLIKLFEYVDSYSISNLIHHCVFKENKQNNVGTERNLLEKKVYNFFLDIKGTTLVDLGMFLFFLSLGIITIFCPRIFSIYGIGYTVFFGCVLSFIFFGLGIVILKKVSKLIIQKIDKQKTEKINQKIDEISQSIIKTYKRITEGKANNALIIREISRKRADEIFEKTKKLVEENKIFRFIKTFNM